MFVKGFPLPPNRCEKNFNASHSVIAVGRLLRSYAHESQGLGAKAAMVGSSDSHLLRHTLLLDNHLPDMVCKLVECVI